MLALDAMGVIYRVGDDLRDLLIPFIIGRGGTVEGLPEIYRAVCRGETGADEIWRCAGLSSEVEDDHLAQLELTPGVLGFLDRARARFEIVAGLSNDVSRWSRKLRARFGLDALVSPWIVSGDVGYRKPSPEIYAALLAATRARPDEVLFIDDRIANVTAARALGIEAMLYDPTGGRTFECPCIMRLDELLAA